MTRAARQPFTPRRQLRTEPTRPGGGRPIARFLAYEGCFQICLTAIGTSPSQPEALSFVQSRCAVLRGAFSLSSNLLPVAAKENEPPPSVGIDWLHKSASVVDIDPQSMREVCPPLFLVHQQLPPLANTQNTEVLRSTVRVTAIRLVSLDGSSSPGKKLPGSSWAEPPQQQRPLKVGYSWKSLFGLPQTSAEPSSVVLQARGHEPTWISFDPSGQGQEGGHIELGPDESSGQLQLTVQAGRRFVAGGVIAVQDLWQLAEAPTRPSRSPHREKSKHQSLVDRLTRACTAPSVAESDPMYGSMWVDVADDHGRRHCSVLISAWLGSRLETITTTIGPVAMPHPQPLPLPLPQPSPLMPFNTFSNHSAAMPSQPQELQPVTSWEAYDCVLAAAIHAEGRGRRKLAIKGAWEWLLAQFALTYGVRRTYASLAYLAWLVRADVISSTMDCLQLLTEGLKPLKATQAQGSLLIEEAALLRSTEEAALVMLASCFEKYYAVSDEAATGILDGDVAATDSPAPVLHHAVLLAEVLSEQLKPSLSMWMIHCFEVAACLPL